MVVPVYRPLFFVENSHGRWKGRDHGNILICEITVVKMCSLDLTKIKEQEIKAASTRRPMESNLECVVARLRSGKTVKEVAQEIGVSHVTLLLWERVCDAKLIEWWRRKGYIFPYAHSRTVKIGRNKQITLGLPIEDCGVTWSQGGDLARVDREPSTEMEYTVNEQHGIYTFATHVPGKRCAILRYNLRCPSSEKFSC